LHEHGDESADNYVPIIQRLQQANLSATTNPDAAAVATPATSRPINGEEEPSVDNKNDYIFVDHDPNAGAKKLLQVLNHYRNDLKQESNSQLDCSRQLVTRLIDLVRPAFSSNAKEMAGVETLNEEIASLHDKRHVEQNEKLEQLHTEICHLKRMLLAATDERLSLVANANNYSMMDTMTDKSRNYSSLRTAQIFLFVLS
jgi:hypothetical protein